MTVCIRRPIQDQRDWCSFQSNFLFQFLQRDLLSSVKNNIISNSNCNSNKIVTYTNSSQVSTADAAHWTSPPTVVHLKTDADWSVAIAAAAAAATGAACCGSRVELLRVVDSLTTASPPSLASAPATFDRQRRGVIGEIINARRLVALQSGSVSLRAVTGCLSKVTWPRRCNGGFRLVVRSSLLLPDVAAYFLSQPGPHQSNSPCVD